MPKRAIGPWAVGFASWSLPTKIAVVAPRPGSVLPSRRARVSLRNSHPPFSPSEKGLIQGIGEAASSLSRAAGVGTEHFKAEREPHKTSSCANAPWRGCRPEECVLPPRLTSPPSPPSRFQRTSRIWCEKCMHLSCSIAVRFNISSSMRVVGCYCCPYLLLINLASWMP